MSNLLYKQLEQTRMWFYDSSDSSMGWRQSEGMVEVMGVADYYSLPQKAKIRVPLLREKSGT